MKRLAGSEESRLSPYVGVFWSITLQEWFGMVMVRKKNEENWTKHLGYFEDEIEAATARDAFVLEQFGEKARLNFPKEGQLVRLEKNRIRDSQ